MPIFYLLIGFVIHYYYLSSKKYYYYYHYYYIWGASQILKTTSKYIIKYHIHILSKARSRIFFFFCHLKNTKETIKIMQKMMTKKLFLPLNKKRLDNQDVSSHGLWTGFDNVILLSIYG